MVLKKSKLGRNTGNSFKTYCYRHQINTHSYVAKFLLQENDSHGECNIDETFENIVDGGLSSNHSLGAECLIYSLNKRQRWMLPNFIEKLIFVGYLDDEDYRVVVYEQSPPQPPEPVKISAMYQLRILGFVTFCDRFIKRKLQNLGISFRTGPQKSVAVLRETKKLGNLGTVSICDSFIIKLRNFGCGYRKELQKHHDPVQRETKKFGVQRKQNLKRKRVHRGTENSFSEETNPKLSTPEIRYELWHNHRNYKCNQIHQESAASIWKTKGRKNKEWVRDSHKGIGHKEKKEYTHGLFHEEEMSARYITEKEHQEDRRQRILEMIFHDPENEDYAPYVFDRSKAKRLVLGDFIDYKHLHKKDDVKLLKNKSEKPATKIQETVVSQVFLTSDEDTVGVCNVDIQSVKNFINTNQWRCTLSKECRTCRFAVSLEGLMADLLFWQKGSISKENPSVFQCALRIHLHAESNRNVVASMEHLLCLTFNSVESRVFNIRDLLSSAESIISQLKPKSTSHAHKPVFLTGEDQVDGKHSLDIDSCFSTSLRPDGHYCDICSCGLPEPVAQGTLLLPCQHFFCNDCLKCCIIEMIRNGKQDITCPAYSCKTGLENITIMSFVSCDMYNQWLQKIEEDKIQKQKLNRKRLIDDTNRKRALSSTKNKLSTPHKSNLSNSKSAVLKDSSLASLARQLGTEEQNGLALAMLLNIPNTDIVNIANNASEKGMLGIDKHGKIETTTKCLLHWKSLHEKSNHTDLKHIKQIERALKDLGKSHLASLIIEHFENNAEFT